MTDDTGRELQGELIDLSPSALSVLVDDTRYDLQETDIIGIRKRRPDSLKNGAPLGLLSVAAVGSLIISVADRISRLTEAISRLLDALVTWASPATHDDEPGLVTARLSSAAAPRWQPVVKVPRRTETGQAPG